MWYMDRTTVSKNTCNSTVERVSRSLMLTCIGNRSLWPPSTMNRYRNVPGLRGPTKASQLTLCQKCLKRDMSLKSRILFRDSNWPKVRHFSFECKVSAQERPYISRPSRTQQLQDPALVPKLTSEVSNDLQRTYVNHNTSVAFGLFLIPTGFLLERVWQMKCSQWKSRSAAE